MSELTFDKRKPPKFLLSNGMSELKGKGPEHDQGFSDLVNKVNNAFLEYQEHIDC